MEREGYRSKRLVGLFLLGYLLFNYPLLSLFNLPRLVAGIPMILVYIFSIWLVLILLTWRWARHHPPTS
ncbi:MAG: hypothetical protein PVH30_08615 [Desulfobacterales bacterium]|jgi:hypothetical protein